MKKMHLPTAARLSPRAIMLIFSIVYFVSYLTRINYAAVITAIIADGNVTRSAASLAVTGAFVTYGAGQLVSGYFSDRIQPTRLVAAALVTTSAVNLCLPLCGSVALRTAVWCLNGLAQAFIWPPLMKLVPALLDEERQLSAGVRINSGGHVGNIAVYLIAPVFIRMTGWRGMFVFSAVMGFVCALAWILTFGCVKIDLRGAADGGAVAQTQSRSRMKWRVPAAVMALTVVTIIIQGAMRDGVTTWVPTYISETFSLGADVSVLTGVAMPVFALICLALTERIYNKVQNVQKCSFVYFTLALAASAALPFAARGGVVTAVLLSAVIVGCMHSINLLQVCILPRTLGGTEQIGFASGALNGCVYIGSALSTYGFARVSETFGWNGTILTWCSSSALGAVICFVLLRREGRISQDRRAK